MRSVYKVSRTIILLTCLFLTSLLPAFSQSVPVQLSRHIPAAAIAKARLLGRMDATERIHLVFVLPLRNQGSLEDLLRRLYDRQDPLYGQYLACEEFTERFGPTEDDYEAVKDFARSKGLTITETHPNRTLLDVTGSAQVVEAAFGLRLLRYQAQDGRKFYAPDTNPIVPSDIAAQITGIAGLDNAVVWHPSHLTAIKPATQSNLGPLVSGPGGGLTPPDIKKAYNLDTISQDGAGQTLGLLELDGYTPSDITTYVNTFGLRPIPLKNKTYNGATGKPVDAIGALEVTLDIDLMNALAPGANNLYVYMAPNSTPDLIDLLNHIATDNLAQQISISWGSTETGISSTQLSSENAALEQMAAQGQSVYAASGDRGAKANGSTLSVQDPASQPYITGVGGTTLSLNSDGSWQSETTWNNLAQGGDASGGGISSIWPVPDYQAYAYINYTRHVPDVSLNAGIGYSIYYQNTWLYKGGTWGGTSASTPLWAAFNALVNQQRWNNGLSLLGFANPAIYQLAQEFYPYLADFHDITTGDNGYWSADTGYDVATGWGSFNGANLLRDLSSGIVIQPLYSFSAKDSSGINTDGSNPDGVIQGSDGNLYGTATFGGKYSYGTIYRLTPTGVFTTLYSFTEQNDGGFPCYRCSLIQGTDGNLYGTSLGGPYGTVFKCSPTGTLTILHSFNGSDGDRWFSGLTEGSPGVFYGMTETGGAYGLGTVYQITSSGAFTTLHYFTSDEGMSAAPLGLTIGPDGYLYGSLQGTGTYGKIFKISLGGTFSLVYTFSNTDGAFPNQLVLAPDGYLYGCTYGGGANGLGTFFKLSSTGMLTTIHAFSQSELPFGCNIPQLTIGIDGNFYGGNTTSNGKGDIICLTPNGDFTDLVSFDETWLGTNGLLSVGSDGKIYGAGGEGLSRSGVIYSFSTAHQVPFLKSVSPATINAGGPSVSLTVNGNRLLGSTVIQWTAGSTTTSLKTAYVSMNKVKAIVPASLIASPGTVHITATNPGGGSSNSLKITVAVTSLKLLTPTLTRNSSSGTITANIPLKNIGYLTAPNVTISQSSLGAYNTTNTLPIKLGNIAAGSTVNTSLTYPDSVGSSGQKTTLHVQGTFTGGSFKLSIPVILP